MERTREGEGASVNPPIAKKIPTNVTIHDDPRSDDYRWLRERGDPDVVAYLRAENEYADAMLAPTAGLRKNLYDEMVARLNETDSSVPVRRDEYLYYTRTEKDRQYEIYCRKRAPDAMVEGPEEVLLDENILANAHAYFTVGAREVSPDHRLLAYTVDTTGAESFDLFVMDLATRDIVDGPIRGLSYDVEWGNDSRTLFYTILDEQMRPHAVRRHRLGQAVEGDVELYREPDPAFFVGVEVTRSREYLFIVMESNTTTEMRVARLDDAVTDGGSSAFKLIQPRKPEVEYHIAHSGESFFILTNDDAFNFRVFEAPSHNPTREQWRELIAHRPAVKIDAIEAFERHLVIIERENGLKRIRVIDLLTRESREVPFDEPVYTVWLEYNPDFHSTVLRFSYSSLTTPRSVFDYDMVNETKELRKRYDVLGGFDPANYASERLYASAVDGTRIPVSLVYRRDTPRDGSAPLLLYGYGAYGVSVEPHFVANRVSLLDRGVIFAIAHVRGGGELGRAWYEKGKRFYKRNTFTDFIACAEHLIAKGYTRAGSIVCYGGSAGGMLMGAVVNMRPELWRATVAVVPFVDVLNTMLDSSLPLTVIEFEEWGNPAEKKDYEYIRSYSPYECIARQDYPPMLVLSGFNDRRVQYWEPAKWVAKLRAWKTDANTIVLRTRMGEGHKGASGRYDYLKDVALEYAFILERVGRAG
jgi:oligopeptidase B